MKKIPEVIRACLALLVLTAYNLSAIEIDDPLLNASLSAIESTRIVCEQNVEARGEAASLLLSAVCGLSGILTIARSYTRYVQIKKRLNEQEFSEEPESQELEIIKEEKNPKITWQAVWFAYSIAVLFAEYSYHALRVGTSCDGTAEKFFQQSVQIPYLFFLSLLYLGRGEWLKARYYFRNYQTLSYKRGVIRLADIKEFGLSKKSDECRICYQDSVETYSYCAQCPKMLCRACAERLIQASTASTLQDVPLTQAKCPYCRNGLFYSWNTAWYQELLGWVLLIPKIAFESPLDGEGHDPWKKFVRKVDACLQTKIGKFNATHLLTTVDLDKVLG